MEKKKTEDVRERERKKMRMREKEREPNWLGKMEANGKKRRNPQLDGLKSRDKQNPTFR